MSFSTTSSNCATEINSSALLSPQLLTSHELHTAMGEGHELAHQVCLNCKARKRKCTKELPSCGLCSKLLVACNYQYGNSSTERSDAADQTSPTSTVPVPVPVPVSVPVTVATQPATHLDVFPATPPFARTHSPSHFEKRSLSDQILHYLIDTGESIPSVTATYFRTIDNWLPIISRERILREFERAGNHLGNELAILLLCMYMVTRVPGNDAQETMMTPLYLEVKSVYSYEASRGESGIELVQAGLLVCLYEHGHGAFENAQVTIAGISRLGMRLLSAHRKTGEPNIQDTEVGHLWWGIVIMDRFMNLGVDAEDIRLEMGSQGTNGLPLPYDLENATQVQVADNTQKTPSGISMGTQPTRLGPFCRTAEATQLLGYVLEFVSRTCSNFEDNEFQKSQQLDRALQELAMALMEQATNGWEECCASIGICYSALLTLHTRIRDIVPKVVLDAGGTSGQENLMAIRAYTRILIHISSRFHMDRAYIDLPALPLPSTFSIYQAAILHIRYSEDEFNTPGWKYGMENLKSSLRHFSKRWDVGRKYLADIDIATAAEATRRESYVMTHG